MQKQALGVAAWIAFTFITGVSLTLAAGPTGTQPVPDKFSVLLAHCDEKGGNDIMDAVSNTVVGTKGGSAEWVPDGGRFKGALRVHRRKEGSSAMPLLEIPQDKWEPTSFAIDFWCKLVQDSPLIGRDIYFVSASNLYFRYSVDRQTFEFGALTSKGWIGCSTNKKDFAVTANTWYHLGGTYDGSEARLYANGKKVSSSEGKGPVLVLGLVLGCVAWDSRYTSSDFEGLIDELRVSNIPREDFGVHEQ